MKSQISQIRPGIFRLRAANPSAMTESGTNTYLLHTNGGAVVIDPGPALPDHQQAILDLLGAAPLKAILVSHAHLDHSALVPALVRARPAPVFAFGRAEAGRSPIMQQLALEGLVGGGEGIDHTFAPDRDLRDGEILDFGGLRIEVIHTPGHMGGHLCFAIDGLCFTADHVMGWASSLVSPPDGDMGAYMASLQSLADRPWQMFLPGHGEPVADPANRLQELIRHRQSREAAILDHLAMAGQSPDSLARAIYTDTPPALLGAAQRNILAHLIDLHARNLVHCAGPLQATAVFHLV